MAPLCKGGCQKSLIFDWGIVQNQLRSPKFAHGRKSTPQTIPPSAYSADTSLCTREAFGAAQNRTLKFYFTDSLLQMPS